MRKLLALGLACLPLAACNASTLQALLPKVLASRSSQFPPSIRGKVYGSAVGPSTMVAIKSSDEPGASVFVAVKVEDGAYSYEFPKTYNETFELFAFNDDNGDGLVGPQEATASGPPERTSAEGRCGKVTVETPTRDNGGKVGGGWMLRTCNEEEGPPGSDFDNADIRFSL